MRKKVAEEVIDSSALLCVAIGEPAAEYFLDGFSRVGTLYIGAEVLFVSGARLVADLLQDVARLAAWGVE